MMGQKKVEIFSRKFHKSLAKQFLEVAIRKSYMLNTNGNKGEKVINVKSDTLQILKIRLHTVLKKNGYPFGEKWVLYLGVNEYPF
jgi:hypothetical protein